MRPTVLQCFSLRLCTSLSITIIWTDTRNEFPLPEVTFFIAVLLTWITLNKCTNGETVPIRPQVSSQKPLNDFMKPAIRPYMLCLAPVESAAWWGSVVARNPSYCCKDKTLLHGWLAPSILRVANPIQNPDADKLQCWGLRQGGLAWEKHEFLFFFPPAELVLWREKSVYSELEVLPYNIQSEHPVSWLDTMKSWFRNLI
jgi:hypothetical protein